MTPAIDGANTRPVGVCSEHPSMCAQLCRIESNTNLISQRLHGRLGDNQDPGLIAVQREHGERLTALERAAADTRGKAWQLFLQILPWLATAGILAAAAWHAQLPDVVTTGGVIP